MIDQLADEAEAAWWYAELDAIVDPVARLVLDLHQREQYHSAWTCRSCPGEDLNPSSWPCDTVERVAQHFGIPVPRMRLYHLPVVPPAAP